MNEYNFLGKKTGRMHVESKGRMKTEQKTRETLNTHCRCAHTHREKFFWNFYQSINSKHWQVNCSNSLETGRKKRENKNEHSSTVSIRAASYTLNIQSNADQEQLIVTIPINDLACTNCIRSCIYTN